MARKRIIYQSESVEINSKSLTGAHPNGITVNGVQSVSYGIDISREDLQQYGDLGAFDRIVLEAPTANAEMTFHVNGVNPPVLNSVVHDAIAGNNCEIRFALDQTEGRDYTASASSSIVGLKGASLTSFSAEASVGSIPTMTMGFEGTDLEYTTSTSTAGPSGIGAPSGTVNIAVPSTVNVDLTNCDTSNTHYAHTQSANLSFDLGVEGLQALGLSSSSDRFQYARVPSYPASASLTVEALAVDKGMSIQLANLQQKGSAGGTTESTGGKVNINVTMGSTRFKLVNATLDSVSFTSSIGDNATCDATFGVSIGSPTSPSTINIIGV